MLKLVDIVKDYRMADSVVHALKGINLNFRKSEFVSILGPSGCGKTTMLNIIGGLDKYTDGDLIINEKSTKEFKSRDWDAYRNRSIGFVFQSYNLIPHLNILQNVELALTISGVPHKKKKALAINALERVGLGGQIKKKPNQLSGGQMQRVAIARAIVNNPEIILADEPTGALDTKTSEQVMDLLQEIADNRLVIMVTHNPELAKRYSTRIIELTDGGVIADSNPYDGLPTILSPVAPISDGEPSPIEQYIKECAELPEPVEEVAVPVKKAPAKKSKKAKTVCRGRNHYDNRGRRRRNQRRKRKHACACNRQSGRSHDETRRRQFGVVRRGTRRKVRCRAFSRASRTPQKTKRSAQKEKRAHVNVFLHRSFAFRTQPHN